MKDYDFKVQTSFFLKSKTFCVEVKAWQWSEDEWAWNVYAHIFEASSMFSDTEWLMSNTHLSGGCTFDQDRITSPMGGIRWDWQRISRTRTVGSDYKHIWDADYSKHGPESGIPAMIKRDAVDLFEQLKEREQSQ